MVQRGIDSALDLLSNETRFEIIAALASQRFSGGDTSGMTFTELFEAVSRDDSGNFNYHLKRLLDRLVTKTGERYRLSHGGVQLFSLLQATTYAPGYQEVIPLDLSCPLCEQEVVGTYREGYFDIGCDGHLLLETYVHPTWIESLSTDEFLRRAGILLHHQIEKIASGFCPLCNGSVGFTLQTDDDPYPIQYHYPCKQCGTELQLHPPQTVFHCVEIGQFYRNQRVELRETPPWELYETFGEMTMVNEDRAHVRFDLTVDGDTAVVTVDGQGNVLSLEER